jgi:hypothetical protein
LPDDYQEEKFMPRYKLKKDCLFIDAYDLDAAKANPANSPQRQKLVIPHAHLMNKSETEGKKNQQTGEIEYPYTMLNDLAGFIGRFIVMGVETDLLLPQIIASEFDLKPDRAKKEVDDAYALMKAYLEEIVPAGTSRQLKKFVGNSTKPALHGHHPGEYDLNFRVNPMGIGFLKG